MLSKMAYPRDENAFILFVQAGRVLGSTFDGQAQLFPWLFGDGQLLDNGDKDTRREIDDWVTKKGNRELGKFRSLRRTPHFNTGGYLSINDILYSYA